MRNLINTLTEASGLTVIPLAESLQLAYYEDKDDFFIIMHESFPELSKLTSEILKDIQFMLNSLVVEQKKSEIFQSLQHRNVNQNLSLILFLEYEEDLSQSFQEINKAEENYLNAKKYILPYKSTDCEDLKSKIADSSNLIKTLNELAVGHSNLMEETDQTWYDLLLNLFIKIPFLNYQSQNGEQSLSNLTEMINSSLDQRQLELLMLIDNNDISGISDIEAFVSNNNMLL
ncbi:hypothetical protein QQY79_04160 [Flavobacterium tructae]|uniref:hypothetical protein n=1 Tax=Flavobacterium tructae TaxID=1114873 RepID=UPI002552019A|nr:hypothetical protein [Flavobacterium tructae]MDL2141703.1 hypothetical protein [Flavobacterium tructae]